ncbi:unnamed protein product [Closterium sp. NIES-65]|nr:unnamed protein product [Closterium sp. NIES-65]
MFAMFDAKDEGQLSDDDLLLQSWDDLKRPSKFYNGYNEVDHYVKQGNLAEYLGLKAVRAIHVPIPVNLIFIGFNASGDHGMRMREGDMRRWLQRMDHVEEHTRAPLNWPSLLARLAHTMGAGGELVRSDDDDDDDEEEEGEGEGEGLEYDLPLISSVHYNYTVHVMEMGERVASVFQAAVRTLSRPDDPTAAAASHDDDDDPADSPPHPHHPSSSSSSGAGGAGQQQWYQVDMGAMAHVVDSLVDSLQLDASAYNVIVLNLNRARARRRYGYRLGLSNAEFNMLKTSPPLCALPLPHPPVPALSNPPRALPPPPPRCLPTPLLPWGQDDRLRQHLLSPGLEKVPQVLDEQHVPQPLFSSRPGHKLAWRHIEPHEIVSRIPGPCSEVAAAGAQSVPWAARMTALLGTVERVVSERGDPRASAARKAQQLLTSGDPRRARALRAALQEADASWQEQCLTDTWIGTRRWALMDLSAGPFSWGPLSPAPHRPAAAAATPTAPLNTAAAAAVGGAAAAVGGAAGGAGGNGSSSSVMGDGWSSSSVVAVDVGAGGSAAWGVRSEASLPSIDRYFHALSHASSEAWEGELRGRLERMAEERLEAVEEGEGEGEGEGQHAVDVLLAELDVYHTFAARHCTHRAVPSALCRGGWVGARGGWVQGVVGCKGWVGGCKGWVGARGGWVQGVVGCKGWLGARGGWVQGVVGCKGWLGARGGWVGARGGWVQGVGGWVQGVGGWVQGVGGWVQGVGGWVQGVGGWVQGVGGWVQGVVGPAFVHALHDACFNGGGWFGLAGACWLHARNAPPRCQSTPRALHASCSLSPNVHVRVLRAELQQKLEEVKDDLAKHQGGSATAGSVFTGRSVRAALERLHSWKFQSVPPDRHAGKGGAGESSPAVTRAWDMLMAELAATLASAMRHVITPSTAAGAYHFYERVSFHLYIISHQAYYERRHTPQYVEEFKAEVQKLCLPGQRFHFSTYRCVSARGAGCEGQAAAHLHSYYLLLPLPGLPDMPLTCHHTHCHHPPVPLAPTSPHHPILPPTSTPLPLPARLLSVAEDAALATAFSASLRAAVLPSAAAGGKASAGGRVQLYLDSHVLQHQLRSLGDDSLQRCEVAEMGDEMCWDSLRGERAQLDVPVFFFAITSDPILIDQSLLAKSLPDMVLSVQLPHRHWPTGVTCNGKEMHADLRDPLAAVLAATMEHLAGLLPAHISFSAAHSFVVQDWRWAAGGHPLAAIGGGLLGGGGASSAHVSSLQQDAMARSFVVTALDEAVATVNRAIAHLAAETTREFPLACLCTYLSAGMYVRCATTYEDTYAVFKRWERQLAGQYNAVVEGWRRVAAAVEAMDYGGALHLLPGIEGAAARYGAGVMGL